MLCVSRSITVLPADEIQRLDDVAAPIIQRETIQIGRDLCRMDGKTGLGEHTGGESLEASAYTGGQIGIGEKDLGRKPGFGKAVSQH